MTTENKTNDELKPCPFCGGEAEYFKYYNADNVADKFRVSCNSCCAMKDAFKSTPENAASSWNTRADQPLPADKRAALDDIKYLTSLAKPDYEAIFSNHEETILAALTEPQPVADLEGLKVPVPDHDHAFSMPCGSCVKADIINNHIDHLQATGLLTTSADVQELKDAVRDLNAEVSRRQREIENNLRPVMPNIGESGSPAQTKHATTIAKVMEK